MTRRKGAPGVFSASGVLGDATLATREKGRALVEALASGVLADIENLRRANVPDAATSGTVARDAPVVPRSTDRAVDGAASAAAPRGPAVTQTFSGWCTLVLSGGGTSWSIEAWRYTIDPPKGEPLPMTLKQPGFIGRERQH